MSIAITDDHVALAGTVADFLSRHDARAAARALLEAPDEGRPAFWDDLAALGWLGLPVAEEHGGSGFGLEEAVVVAEQLGRAVTPGPAIPTMAAAAVIAAAGDDELRGRLLPGLADGTLVGAVGTGPNTEGDNTAGNATGGDAGAGAPAGVTVADGRASGSVGVVVSGHLADVIVVASGPDAVVVEREGGGVDATVPANLDPTRRSARVELDGAAATVLPGAAGLLTDVTRLLFAAEATGLARDATEAAAAYARERLQFGRPIGTYQAVKHHCANMLVATELATAAVWDAARAADAAAGATDGDDADQRASTSATAAALAAIAADLAGNLNMQVHGGIGFTWEHDAHVILRRATALGTVLDGNRAAADATDRLRAGTRRSRDVDLPPEAEPLRDEVREFVASLDGLDDAARRSRLVESGYAVPHWPEPWGRGAGAVEQLVIEQEFRAAGVQKPGYGITGWVILTLVQHATEDQIARWVRPALDQEVIWCQLFSEPDAGSDAAGIKTRATRVDGGWQVNGQKVWTSGAHQARYGFATVRTDPDVPKHQGITTMVIDMEADGVEVRPLRMTMGSAEFNEVFFDDVFVPDDDVVGPVDGGWTVARATLGNESVSIGGGQGGMATPPDALLASFDAHPERLYGGAARIGRYLAHHEAMSALNLRSAHRAVAGGEPGPEGSITKLVLSELGHDAAAILTELGGPDAAFLDGPAAMAGFLVLVHRGMSIAGGTSEIKRNQIGERLLGLPRDPLIK